MRYSTRQILVWLTLTAVGLFVAKLAVDWYGAQSYGVPVEQREL